MRSIRAPWCCAGRAALRRGGRRPRWPTPTSRTSRATAHRAPTTRCSRRCSSRTVRSRCRSCTAPASRRTGWCSRRATRAPTSPTPGDEVLGFVSAMLAQGTAGVVASIAAVPDVAAVDLMLELHRGRAGRADARAGAARGPRPDRPATAPRASSTGARSARTAPPERGFGRRRGGDVLWGYPKTAGRRPCRAHAVLAARSPEVPQQRRPAQVRVPGWFGLRRAA